MGVFLLQVGKDFIRWNAWAAGYTSLNCRAQLMQLQRLGLLLIFQQAKACAQHIADMVESTGIQKSLTSIA